MNLSEAASCPPASQPFLLGRSEWQPARREIVGRIFSRSKSELRLALYAVLFGMDVVCISAGFLGAGLVWAGSPFGLQALRTLGIVLPTFAAIAVNGGAYSTRSLQRPTFGARKVIGSLLCAGAVAVALLFYLKVGIRFSRVIFALGTILSTMFAVAGRVAFGEYVGRKYAWTFSNNLVITDGTSVAASTNEIVVSTNRVGIEPRTDDPIMLDRLSRLLENCDRVIVACPPERRAQWTRVLKGTTLDVEITVPELTSMGAVRLATFRGDSTLVVSCGPLTLRDRLIKRTFDLVVAGIALLFVTPLLLIVAISIAVESDGPIFFRQQRVGQNNRIFSLLKFRSMRVECTDPNAKTLVCREDSRLTRLGRLLRLTSIDELPQLLNVIAGDMSIVGPRPHALGATAENALYWAIEGHYFDRHAMKPGMTGLAQVRGFRGATLRRDDLSNRLGADLEYLADWTIWRDIKIVLATFRVLIHPNAY